MLWIADITTEARPFGVSSFTVPEASGNFCARGGRFGAHSSNENFTPIYYKRILFLAHFNAGVRAVDIRDPQSPARGRVFHPADHRQHRASLYQGQRRRPLQGRDSDQHVEVDDRGYIYIVDRANTGLHVLALTGSAREVANFPR